MRTVETEPIGIMIWVGQIYISIYNIYISSDFSEKSGEILPGTWEAWKNGPVCHCSQGAEEASAQHQSQDFWLHVPEKKRLHG